MSMILLAAACYTICALSDKYAVNRGRLNGTEFTFIMAAATVVFMSPILPFIDHSINICWQSAVFIALIAADKLLEFQMASKVLTEMSAFELKAWVGIIIFVSYFTDYFMGKTDITAVGIAFIIVTAAGLFMIAKSNSGSVNYKKIVLPLIVYLVIRFGYGLIMLQAEKYMPSSMILYFALILLTLCLLPKISFPVLLREKTKGSVITAVTKLPNAVGLVAENAAIAVSLTGASLIQPIVLIALFFIGFIVKDEEQSSSPIAITGSIVSIVGIVGFELLK